MVVPFRIVAWRRKCVGLDMKKIIIRIEQDGETGAEIGRKVQVGRGNERRNYIPWYIGALPAGARGIMKLNEAGLEGGSKEMPYPR